VINDAKNMTFGARLADINAIKRRFLALNRERLQRAQSSLRERQRDFLDLLPLLFHVNHMLLPGFVSSNTPMGVSDYAPDKRTLEAAKKISRNFSYKRKALPRFEILSLFLMGSSGTIAYSKKSDFDIWICHPANIKEELLEELRKKAEAIEKWAASLDLEVHFFLMDPSSFRAGKQSELSKEGSGSAQHYLLLEEFYRTGLLLAGRYPAWWLVPPDKEKEYDSYLEGLKNSFAVRETEYVDFGGIPLIPAEEFFGAALWQLFKGIDSPYKSVLKLLLMEVYAHEYPASDLLCQRFKKVIYEGEISLDALDPYIMLYYKIEEHLKKTAEKERLELFRRCFYFKVNERLSTPDSPRQNSWRRDLIKSLAHAWDWDPAYLETLDARLSWKINRVLRERRILTSELTQSYRFLSDFAHEHAQLALINQKDLNILGRKLYAAFERKAGKVEIVNRGISQGLWESHLTFVHKKEDDEYDGWALFIASYNEVEHGGFQPIKRAHNVVDLVVWCYFNDMVNDATAIGLHAQDGALTLREIKLLINSLQNLFPKAQSPETSMEDLSKVSRMEKAALFINLGVDPMAIHTRQGMHYTSNKTDALSYGGVGENLALTFDMVTLTSWREALTFRYVGVNGLMNCLCEYVRWMPPSMGILPPPVSIQCFSANHGVTIGKRIEELFRNIVDGFYRSAQGASLRYVLSVENIYYLLWCENDALRYKRIESYDDLLVNLAAEQRSFSHVEIDQHALHGTPLPQIFAANKSKMIQVFYRMDGDCADVYVVDESGSLYYQRMLHCESVALINQYTLFFDSVLRRQHLLGASERQEGDGLIGVEFYQIGKDGMGKTVLVRNDPIRKKGLKNYYNVQIIVDKVKDGKLAFTIYCGDEEFTSLEYGNGLFREVARHVMTQRQSGLRYPIYITDINLPSAMLGEEAGRRQTIHFLNYKRQIEDRLNEALHELDRQDGQAQVASTRRNHSPMS
jgi:adenylate cyclase class 1